MIQLIIIILLIKLHFSFSSCFYYFVHMHFSMSLFCFISLVVFLASLCGTSGLLFLILIFFNWVLGRCKFIMVRLRTMCACVHVTVAIGLLKHVIDEKDSVAISVHHCHCEEEQIHWKNVSHSISINLIFLKNKRDRICFQCL